LITLGVTDVTRARTFYERLGWHGQEVEETVFFQAGGRFAAASCAAHPVELPAPPGKPEMVDPADLVRAEVTRSSSPECSFDLDETRRLRAL